MSCLKTNDKLLKILVFLIAFVKAFKGSDYVRHRRLDFIENVKVNLMKPFKGNERGRGGRGKGKGGEERGGNLLPTYSSACRFIHLPGLFAQRAATPLLRTDPALSLGTALLCMQPQRFGTRYPSP